MKYYKDSLGEVFALEIDGSQDSLIRDDWQLTVKPVQQEFSLNPKLAGVEFNGITCSATKEDMVGVMYIKDKAKNGGSAIMRFENGSRLTLNNENIDQFFLVWSKFRDSFF